METVKTEFVIGEKPYSVVKYGWSQADQAAKLGNWLAVYGTSAYKAASNGGQELLSGIELVAAIVSALDGEGLIELFSAVFGCPKSDAMEYFDIDVLYEGVMAMYNSNSSIKRLVSRFFSNFVSTSSPLESSTQSE